MVSITDYARMCKAYGGRCSTCPLNDLKDDYVRNCAEVLSICTNKASDIIDKWCAEHTQKTYLQDFWGKFPNANVKDGYVISNLCRARVYGQGECCINRSANCTTCWNEVMP